MIYDKLAFLQNIFGQYYRVGKEYLFYCPKCKHHKPKLSINLEKDKYKCWVCLYSGNSIHGLIKDKSSKQAKIWQTNYGLKDTIDLCRGTKKINVLSFPQDYQFLLQTKSAESIKAQKYLVQRGVTKQDVYYYKMGLSQQTYPGRIVVPFYNKFGELNYFVAASYCNQKPKYKNAQISSHSIVANELMIDTSQPVVIVEGLFDMIKAGRNSIPLFGSSMPEKSEVFQFLVRHGCQVVLCLDKDAERKQFGIAKLLKLYGLAVRTVNLGKYNDIGEMPRLEAARAIEAATGFDALRQRIG